MKQRAASALLTLTQVFYHSTYCLTVYFASVYLLNRGFSSARVGLILGLSYVLSTLVQQAIPKLIAKTGVRMSALLGALYALMALLSASLLWLPMGEGALCAVLVVIFSLQVALGPSVDSLYRGYELNGYQMSFGLFRGVGSGMFALTSLGTGLLLKRLSPALLPAFYLCTCLCLSLCLFTLRAPNAVLPSPRKSEAPLLARDKPFAGFLAGAVLLLVASAFVDHFLMQLLSDVGGQSDSLGIALSVGAFVEMPLMALYPLLRKRFSTKALLAFSGWAWVGKNVLIFAARSPGGIYAAQLMQCASYAVYTIAVVDYIAVRMRKDDFLQAQAHVGSAKTIASLFATLFGGYLLDTVGARSSMLAVIAFSIAGAACVTRFVLRPSAKA